MKKIKYATIIILLILVGVFVQAKIVPDGARIDITTISQEPDPVEPGEVVDLRFKVENSGGDPAEDIKIRVVEEFPFTVYAGGAEQDIGTLKGRQRAEEGIGGLKKGQIDD